MLYPYFICLSFSKFIYHTCFVALLVHRLLQTTSIPIKFSQKRQKAIAEEFHQQWLFVWKFVGASFYSNLQANRNTINNASGGTLYQIYITGPF